MNKIYETFITDTGSEPVTLEQLKTFCRVTDSDNDDLLTELITIARKKIERYTLLSLVDKTIVLTGCLDSMFLLPWPNINEVTGVRFLEGQIELQTLVTIAAQNSALLLCATVSSGFG